LNLNLFLIIICSLFFLGCDKKKEIIDKFKNEQFELQSISKEEIIDSGIIVLENNNDFVAYKEDNFFVCDYFIFLDSKVESLEKIKNFIKPIQKLYSQDDWILEEPIYGKSYISITGNKKNKYLYIIVMYKYLKNKLKYELKFHCAINNF